MHDSSSPVTDIDVFLMVSSNGGASWSGPTQVDSGEGDQWFPWVDVNPTNGTIGILYNDRGPFNGALYVASVVEGAPGSLAKTTVSARPSDPTQSRFFQSGVAGCENCAVFNGDYTNIEYGSDGKANMVWTDMSAPSEDIAGLFAQFIFYARK